MLTSNHHVPLASVCCQSREVSMGSAVRERGRDWLLNHTPNTVLDSLVIFAASVVLDFIGVTADFIQDI